MVWRITPIKMGSLLVLEVHGKGTGDAARVRLLEKGRYRRLVEAVKVACEGPPAVRFLPPPKRGLPFLRRKPRASEDVTGTPPAAPEPAAPTEPAPSQAEPVPKEPPKPKKGKPTKAPPKRRPKK